MCYLMKITYFEHSHPRHCRDTWWLGTEILGGEVVKHCKNLKDTLPLGTAGILCGWVLQGCFAVGHCRDTGILRGWALQGYFGVGHSRDTLRLGTAGIFGGVLWHCKDTLRLGTAGTPGGWTLQGCLVAGHCWDAMRLGPAVRPRAEGEDNTDFKI